jgi:hypothetical protein
MLEGQLLALMRCTQTRSLLRFGLCNPAWTFKAHDERRWRLMVHRGVLIAILE